MEHPGVAQGTSTHGFGGSRVPERRPIIKEIDDTNHEVQDLTRHWAVGPANLLRIVGRFGLQRMPLARIVDISKHTQTNLCWGGQKPLKV